MFGKILEDASTRSGQHLPLVGHNRILEVKSSSIRRIVHDLPRSHGGPENIAQVSKENKTRSKFLETNCNFIL